MDTATREEILARYRKHVERFEGAGRKRRPRAVAPAQPEPEKPATTTLSSREVEVLQAVANGLNNRQVARSLYVTEETVKAHLRRIAMKLGTSSRAGAVATGFRAGILQ